MSNHILTGPDDAGVTLLLAHGAGAPMDSPFMSVFAELLGERGLRTARFEFGYMAARRETGARRPPPRAEKLAEEYRQAIAGLGQVRTLVIGGKSLGGRVASLIAEEAFNADRIAGLLCLGYPFHPPGRPDRLRTAHLAQLTVPTLIVQGERDPFGGRDEVPAYGLPGGIALHWAADGDHELKPRGASGLTEADNWRAAADAIADWAGALATARGPGPRRTEGRA